MSRVSNRRRSPMLLAGLPLVALIGIQPAASQTIDTTPSWNGSEALAPFGSPDTSTYGQTITPPNGAGRLSSFTFYLRETSAAISYQAHVYQWDGANGRITGPSLYSSAVLTTPNSNSGNFIATTINTGGIAVSPGVKYALFFSTAGVVQGPNSGTNQWGFVSSNVYAGGGLIYYNTGNDFARLSNSGWDCQDCGIELAFLAVFGNASFATLARTRNQASVANALQAGADTNPTGMAGTLVTALYALDSSTAPAAFDALSGEGISGAQQMALGASSQFMTTVFSQGFQWLDGDRGGSAGGPGGQFQPPSFLGATARSEKAVGGVGIGGQPWRFWAAGFGATASLDAKSGQIGSANLSTHTGGFAAGVDFAVDRNTLIGAAAGASASGFSVDQRATSGTAAGLHAGIYGVKRMGAFYLMGTADYGRFDNDTKRWISGVGATERADGEFSSTTWSGRVEAGWKNQMGAFNLTPFAGVQATRLELEGFRETNTVLGAGAGVLNLAVGSQSLTSFATSIGAQIDTKIQTAGGLLTPFARVAWLHEFNRDRDITATLVALPISSFTVQGARAPGDAVKVNAGVKLDVGPNVALFSSFDGEFSNRSESYAGSGGIRIKW